MTNTPLRLDATCVGRRVRLVRDIERYPHFVVPKGRTGRIVHVEGSHSLTIQMDKFFKGGKPWDYQLDLDHFEDMATHDFSADLEVIP